MTTALPPEDKALALLQGADQARTNPLKSALAVRAALAEAPDDPEILTAAYRFYFYNHEYAQALPLAENLLVQSARRLNIPTDWRMVGPDDAPFSAMEFAPGLYMQGLVALGYCAARLGQDALAQEALKQAARLDPKDRFGGGWLLHHLQNREEEDA